MGAAFPQQIKAFKRHRNLLDDVDASDINAIQDEVVAIEQVLGPLITRLTQVTTPPPDPEEEDPPPPVPEVTQIEFDSLADRLAYIEAGKHMAAFSALNGLGGTVFVSPGSSAVIPMNGVQQDTHGAFSNGNVYVPKAGFWIFTGGIQHQAIDPNGPGSGPNYLETPVTTHVDVLGQQETTIWGSSHGNKYFNTAVHTQVTGMGWLRAGDPVSLSLGGAALGYANLEVRWYGAWIQGVWIRGF